MPALIRALLASALLCGPAEGVGRPPFPWPRRPRALAGETISARQPGISVQNRPPAPVGLRTMVAGSLIFGAGDVIAQLLERRGRWDEPRNLQNCCDWDRLWQSMFLGATYGGIVYPAVYGLAENLFPGRGFKRVMLKTCVSCGILSPVGGYFNMLSRRLMRGEVFSDAVAVCNANVVEVILADLCVFPPYDIACYSLIPPPVRPYTTSVVSCCWGVYISSVAQRTNTKKGGKGATPPRRRPKRDRAALRAG